jgi:hypothetical protein
MFVTHLLLMKCATAYCIRAGISLHATCDPGPCGNVFRFKSLQLAHPPCPYSANVPGHIAGLIGTVMGATVKSR